MEKENKDSRSRKWQLTINNPLEKDMPHDIIKQLVETLKSLCYWCMCDETGENGTYHTHIYLAFNSAMRFSTLKNKFPFSHLEMARGTSLQNRDYIRKEGKWESDKKKETNHIDTFEEYGAMPIERQGQRNDLNDLYDMIKQGMTNYEILEQDAKYMLQLEKIEKARQIALEEKYKNIFRNLEVTYIYGKTGTGKSRTIMELYGYTNVYRITDYEHPFDGYKYQPVIIFEEFRSSLKIQDMLNYLDGYPLELPCRYNNKIACFEKIYIISNIALEEQYKSVQREYSETWNAFLRRIRKVVFYGSESFKEYKSVEEYINSFHDIVDDEELPFKKNK